MSTTLRETRDSYDSDLFGHSGELCWELCVAHHPDPGYVGRTAAIDGNTILGREVDLFGHGGLGDGRVSRQHARIVVRDQGGLDVDDLGSSNGTFLNGARLRQRTGIQPYDIIRMGSILLMALRRPQGFRPRRHERLIGASPALSRVVEAIEAVAPHATTVLVLGETGTGKEVAARAIHELSGRRGEFCAVNCAGMADTLVESELFGHVRGAFSGADRERRGLVEAAAGGTLFLDEIGDASPVLQRSLLRFLQQGEVRRVGATGAIHVDTRVIAATHRNVTDASFFRPDLYARLARLIIELPPLRRRVEDIPLLMHHFLGKFAGVRYRVDWRFTFALLRYGWPRNVRELEGVVERAVIESQGAGAIALTPALQALLTNKGEEPQSAGAAPGTEPELAAPPERRRRRRAARPSNSELEALLQQCDGNITTLAARLGAGRNTVYRWLRDANISLADFRAD